MKNKKNVFISHPTPCNKDQKFFLSLIKKELEQYDLNPINLGQNNWSFESPLKPIKTLMEGCVAAIVIGLERHHCYIGYEKEFTKDSKETLHKYTSSPWVHIEAGMAYQKGIPLLILKENKIYEEGIFDPQISNSFIFNFELKKMQKKLSPKLKQLILSWVKNINNK